ncbi:MAG: hypothetical protein Q9195_003844 [Heterodermia aff. obscurata]
MRAQHAAAKIATIRSTLELLYNQSLTDELHDLLDLIISPSEPKDETQLGSYLSRHAPDPSPLGLPLSQELSLLSGHLLKLADPSIQQGRTIDRLVQRKKELEKSKTKLHNERLKLASATCKVLETQQEIFTTTIKVLESVKYGSVARANNAEVSYLVAAAEGLDEKLRVMKLEALQSIYDPEVRNAIQAYKDHLAQVRARLQARERLAKEKLAQYEKVGRSMGDIANRYVELMQEVENVKAQIQRLDDTAH